MATYDLASAVPPYLFANDILNCSYSGTFKSISLPPGTYKLECWGAQGGTYNSSYAGGKGGYASGNLSLETTTTLYLYAGGQGSRVTTASTAGGGGFNGGGNGATGSNTSYCGIGGGGASDIRIGSTDLKARVIVAGGGGAAGYYSSSYCGNGGIGGGTSGGSGTSSNSNYTVGGGATQTAGGASYGGTTSYSPGYFGGGGGWSSGTAGNGGGGGWYGGGSSTRVGAGGGSGYVYTSSTASNYPSGCLLDENYYLTSASTSNGGTSFTGTGGSSETGHSGNGYVRITIISCEGSPTLYSLTSSIPSSSVIKKTDILNCDYSGSAKTLNLPVGTYKLECWGAAGGNGYNSSTYAGGKGGYSTGILTLLQPTTLYLYVGQQGKGSSSTGVQTGGWNGGGSGGYHQGGSGGGASDIRIGSTDLKARVIVAGAGGGGCYYTGYYGGAGGGAEGGDGTGYSTTYNAKGATQTAGGAAGSYNGGNYMGTAGSLGTGGAAATSTTADYGRSGGGGGGWYGGGGGGYRSDSRYYYYGQSGGSGGSGYVYTSTTSTDYPAGCLLDSNSYLGSATTIGGGTSIVNPNGSITTGHSGNGYIRITVINAYQPVTAPILTNTSRTYTNSPQSPTETGYDSNTMVRKGVFTASLPNTYTVIYELKDGYIWSDLTLNPKSFTWQITSNWKKVQSWTYDSTISS